jgi:hypothetical protein
MEFVFMECIMEGHNTVVVLDFVAWLVPSCVAEYNMGVAVLKCGDDS